jgi:serine/threonine protein kinase
VPIENWKARIGPDPLSAEFIREVKPMLSVSSQYVVSLYDAFQKGPYVHIVMEFCERGNLRQYLKERDTALKPVNEDVCCS